MSGFVVILHLNYATGLLWNYRGFAYSVLLLDCKTIGPPPVLPVYVIECSMSTSAVTEMYNDVV